LFEGCRAQCGDRGSVGVQGGVVMLRLFLLVCVMVLVSCHYDHGPTSRI